MIGIAIAVLVAAPDSRDAKFIESRIDVKDPGFHYEFVRVDDDARTDLILSTAESNQAALQIHRQRSDGSFAAEPDWRMSVPPDVVAFACLDVRPDAGTEILLLTRSGVFSLSPHRESLQENLRREMAIPIFPSLAASGAVNRWRMVGDVDGDGREEIAIVSGLDLVLLGVSLEEDGTSKLIEKGRASGFRPLERESSRLEFQGSGSNWTFTVAPPRFFKDTRSSQASFPLVSFFYDLQRMRLPGLIDWNGDGCLDAVLRRDTQLRVTPYDPKNHAFTTAVTVPIPQMSESSEGDDRTFELRDIDADGDLEVIMTERLDNGLSPDQVVVVVPGEGGGKLAAEPSARVKFSALAVRHEWVDVDGDSLLDLFSLAMRVPTGITSLASVRLEVSALVHRGEGQGRLSRKPSLRLERSYRPEELERIQETLQVSVSGRFAGTKLQDLILIQPDGGVEIHALERSGDGLVVVEDPWTRFRARAIVQSLETWDLSADGISDLSLIHERGLTLFVSGGGSP